MRHQNTADAAENINVLLEYLDQMESATSRYVYRGQVIEWQEPLIPSLYRRSIRLDRIFTYTDPEYALSLRKCGRSFIEMKPDSSIEKLVREWKELKVRSDEYQAIMSLAANVQFSISLETDGWNVALAKVIHPEKLAYVMHRLPIWKMLIEELQRGHVRHDGFVQPFGYMLEMTIAQQYGFASELLDFTSDLKVAAFFATHDAPHYRFKGFSLAKRTGSPCGVIYRLPSAEGNVTYKRIDDYNYYTCPAQLHMRDLCKRFEDKSSPDMGEQWVSRLSPEVLAAVRNGSISLEHIEAQLVELEMEEGIKYSVQDAIDKFLRLYYSSGEIRYYRLVDMPPGSFESSRLGRQSAVLVVPDELRETIRPAHGQHYATFQAMEDVTQRDGFDRFYFCQSDVRPDIGAITREYLWPLQGDAFKIMVSRVLDPSTEAYSFSGRGIPKRLSLVSVGYTE